MPRLRATRLTAIASAVRRLGSFVPELVTNGTFGIDVSGWGTAGPVSISRDTSVFQDGALRVTVTSGGGSTFATQTLSGLTVGLTYVLSADVYTPSSNAPNNRATIGIQPSSFNASGSVAQQTVDTAQNLSLSFVATSTSQTVYMSVVTSNFSAWGAPGSVGVFDNISVRKLSNA